MYVPKKFENGYVFININIYLHIPARFGFAYAAAICRSKDLWLMKGKHGFLLQKIGAYTIQLCLPAIEKN